MKRRTIKKISVEQKLRKMIQTEIKKVLNESISLENSKAYKIFKQFRLPYGSLWAKNDDQDEKVDEIYDALIDAGFEHKYEPGQREYDSYLVNGDEKVYYSVRTGSPGLSAIQLIKPAPPTRPKRTKK